jgi:hypothetical protein
VKRLIRFFLLMAIRVMAVCTVVIWGVSQLRVTVASVDCGNFAISVTGSPGGFVMDGYRVPNRAGVPKHKSRIEFWDPEDQLSWEARYEIQWCLGADRRSRMFGGALWMRRNSNTLSIGIRYWLAVTILLLTYAAVQFATRKKRLSRLAELKV